MGARVFLALLRSGCSVHGTGCNVVVCTCVSLGRSLETFRRRCRTSLRKRWQCRSPLWLPLHPWFEKRR